MHAALVIFEQISLEFFDFPEIHASFAAFEFVVDDGFIEIQTGVVILGTDGDGCGAVVVERCEEVVDVGMGFPFMEVVKDELVFGVAEEEFSCAEGQGGDGREGFWGAEGDVSVVVLGMELGELFWSVGGA